MARHFPNWIGGLVLALGIAGCATAQPQQQVELDAEGGMHIAESCLYGATAINQQLSGISPQLSARVLG